MRAAAATARSRRATAPNAYGNYQYAYSGLGALSGFATSTSSDNGHTIATAGADANGGITSNGVAADRQWMTFTDDHTVLLSWNQQVPRNVVVQRSTDGGLTYSPVTSIAAPNAEFPGPMRFIASKNVVYMPWTKGEQVNLAVSSDGGTTWTDCKVASGDTVKGGTAGFAVADHDSAGNVYVVWADSSLYHTWLSVLTADKLAGCNQATADVAATADGEPTVDPGFSAPLQVDRDAVRTTVFPWVSAGGAPGRVAVAFYGTTSDGDPNSGDFKAAWNVYVNQSLNALAATRTVSQVQATTHPFHYDSICLNGLGCDLAVPAATGRSRTSSRSASTRRTGGCPSCSTATTRSRTSRSVTSRRRWSCRRSPGRRTAGARSPSRGTRSCGPGRPTRRATRCRTTR